MLQVDGMRRENSESLHRHNCEFLNKSIMIEMLDQLNIGSDERSLKYNLEKARGCDEANQHRDADVELASLMP